MPAHASPTDAKQVVAKLDTDFQTAVKANDAQAMERILGENMILVLGNGTTNTRAELLHEAVRTGTGWRYVFGQASLHLPDVRDASEVRTNK